MDTTSDIIVDDRYIRKIYLNPALNKVTVWIAPKLLLDKLEIGCMGKGV